MNSLRKQILYVQIGSDIYPCLEFGLQYILHLHEDSCYVFS